MKFSEKKFLSFTREKQQKIWLEFIKAIESNWEIEKTRRELIADFSQCLAYLRQNGLNKIAEKLRNELNLREFLALVVPLERRFGRNMKDEDFLIFTQDGKETETEKIPLSLILDNLRSSFNIGSIFRTAECLGISEILLCGYSATPENPKVRKTAMGTEKKVKWQHFEKVEQAIDFCKNKNISVYALETASNAKKISEINFPNPLAVILGNEALGISKEILKSVDEVVQIPLAGWKNSLNVGVAAAICSYEIRQNWEETKF